jgi:VWFA-related protein
MRLIRDIGAAMLISLFLLVSHAGTIAWMTPAITLARASSAQEPPTFPAGVELVRIEAVVVGADGRPVTGLTAADFEIVEKEGARPIVTFEPIVVQPEAPAHATAGPLSPPTVSTPIALDPGKGRTFLVFFDDVHVGPVASETVRQQLVGFLERELRDGDVLTVRAPLRGIEWTARTAYERSRLPDVIEKIQGHFVRDPFHTMHTDFEVMYVVEHNRLPDAESSGFVQMEGGPSGVRDVTAPNPYLRDRYEVMQRLIRRTTNALVEAIGALDGVPGRKSLILYSEGFVRSPGLGHYDRVVDAARRAHVAIYFVDPRGLRSGLGGADGSPAGKNPLMEMETSGGGTTFLANATGGRAAMSNDVTVLFKEAMVESSAYYLLGFQPSGQQGERRIRVRVRGDGLTVRAPDRYFAGPRREKPAPPLERGLAAVADASAVPVRVGAFFLKAPEKKTTAVTLAVEVGRGGSRTRAEAVDVVVEARPLAGREVVRADTRVTLAPGGGAVTVTPEIRLAPGLWQARVVARDPSTGAQGSVLHTIDVPGPDTFALSSPTCPPAPDGRPSLERRVDAGGTLRCAFDVFGSSGAVSVGHTLWRDGVAVRETRATILDPASGTRRREIATHLGGLVPGDYLIELRVHDQTTGRDLKVREPFTIAADLSAAP